MHTTLLLCSERSLAILIFSQRLRYVLDKYTNLHRSKRGSTCLTKVSHLCYACLAHKSQRVLFAQFVGERAEVIVGSAAMLVLKWWGICRSLPSSNFTFPDHLWKKITRKLKSSHLYNEIAVSLVFLATFWCTLVRYALRLLSRSSAMPPHVQRKQSHCCNGGGLDEWFWTQ